MVDPISISILITGILLALSRFIKESHMKKIKCLCFQSDCSDSKKSKSNLTPPESPIDSNI